MTLKTSSRTLCSFFVGLFSLSLMSMQMPAGQAPMNPGDDPFSPENIAQVAEEISKLTPEQQEQLYKESLDYLSKELNLAPDEVEKMIMDEFTQAGGQQPEAPQPVAAPKTESEEPPAKKQKIEEKIVPVQDLDAAVNLLKNLADKTDEIMRKTSGLPDLPSRIERWVEQRRLPLWQAGLTWASFKKQLELFVQKLGKLQAKDPHTNTYLYVPALLENISFKNALERMYRNLVRSNELFVTSSFDIDTAFDDPLTGAGSLSAEAKEALINILNTYGEAFYKSAILKECDALIQKFDPKAQQLRKEEEEKAKKALEASKSPRITGRIKEGGSKDSGLGGRQYYGEPSDGGYYPGSGYSPYGSSYGSYPSDSSSFGKDKVADTKDDGGKDSGKKVGDKKDREELEKSRSYLFDYSKEIASSIFTLGAAIKKDFFPGKIDAIFKKDKSVDTSFIESMHSITAGIEEVVSKITSLKSSSKDFGTDGKKRLFLPIINAYNAYKEDIDTLLQKLSAVKLETLTAEQQTTYFGKQSNGAKASTATTGTLSSDIRNRLQTLVQTDLAGFETLNTRKISSSLTSQQALDLLQEIEEANNTPKKVVASSKSGLSFAQQIEERAKSFEASRSPNVAITKEIEELRSAIKTVKSSAMQQDTQNGKSVPTNVVQSFINSLTRLRSVIAGLSTAGSAQRRM